MMILNIDYLQQYSIKLIQQLYQKSPHMTKKQISNHRNAAFHRSQRQLRQDKIRRQNIRDMGNLLERLQHQSSHQSQNPCQPPPPQISHFYGPPHLNPLNIESEAHRSHNVLINQYDELRRLQNVCRESRIQLQERIAHTKTINQQIDQRLNARKRQLNNLQRTLGARTGQLQRVSDELKSVSGSLSLQRDQLRLITNKVYLHQSQLDRLNPHIERQRRLNQQIIDYQAHERAINQLIDNAQRPFDPIIDLADIIEDPPSDSDSEDHASYLKRLERQVVEQNTRDQQRRAASAEWEKLQKQLRQQHEARRREQLRILRLQRLAEQRLQRQAAQLRQRINRYRGMHVDFSQTDSESESQTE